MPSSEATGSSTPMDQRMSRALCPSAERAMVSSSTFVACCPCTSCARSIVMFPAGVGSALRPFRAMRISLAFDSRRLAALLFRVVPAIAAPLHQRLDLATRTRLPALLEPLGLCQLLCLTFQKPASGGELSPGEAAGLPSWCPTGDGHVLHGAPLCSTYARTAASRASSVESLANSTPTGSDMTWASDGWSVGT